MDHFFRVVFKEDATDFGKVKQIKEGFINDLFNMQIRKCCQNSYQ